MFSLIEWNWNLDPLTTRDATANNLAHALDFTQPKNLVAPQFSVPSGPFGTPCAAASAKRAELEALQFMARRYGFQSPR